MGRFSVRVSATWDILLCVLLAVAFARVGARPDPGVMRRSYVCRGRLPARDSE